MNNIQISLENNCVESPLVFIVYWYYVTGYLLKTNLNASKPSEHPPVMGKISKRVDEKIGRKDKNS